ncbi:hypothetical protein JW859_12225 [bacterium]|nr:hypothetical protein [bacterium]
MRKRFPLLALTVAALVTLAASPWLLANLPCEYGELIDLNSGRERSYRSYIGLQVITGQTRNTILYEHYCHYLDQPAEPADWFILRTYRHVPLLETKNEFSGAVAANAMADVVQELNQLLQQALAPGQPELNTSDAARAELLQRTLGIVKQTRQPRLAFQYLQDFKRMARQSDREITPTDFPTAEEYIEMAREHGDI